VYGGGGLPGFTYRDVRLGMFGHAHAVVGPVMFNATNGVLQVDLKDPLAEGGSGTLVGLENVGKAEVQLLPIELARPNTNAIQERVDVSLSGTFAEEPGAFVGAAALSNSNGVLHLSAYFYESGPLFVNVFSNGAPVGPRNLEMPGPIQLTGNGRLIAVGGNADMLSAFPGFMFAFDAPMAVQTTQGNFVGDRVDLSATNWIRLADLIGLAIVAQAIPSFTITGESSTSFAPQLSIQHSNNNVLLSWPDPARAYFLQTRNSFTDSYWGNLETGIGQENGTTTATYSLSESNGPSQYFRLIRFVYQY
jgi:hypothetical protein